MANIKIIGSCSGTEPILNKHHTSVLLTVNGSNYFFDAGENCSRLAHLGGDDLLSTRAVFISHTHYDHIGGLCGLFWNIRKLCKVNKKAPTYQDISLFMPNLSVWESIKNILASTEGGFFEDINFTVTANSVTQGLVYKDENVKVFAYPTQHFKAKDGSCLSFSYRIELGGRSIVYSGDFGSVSDLALPVANGCDFLLAETGHHKVKDVCDFAESHFVKELVFYHHGREILEDRESVKTAINSCNIKTTISTDGTIINL